jgi:hypothetical protein
LKKIFFLSLVSLVLWSCNCKKNAVPEKNSKAAMLASCPDGFDCRLEVLLNKSMVVKTDGTGATYFELENQNGKTVYRYEIKQKQDQQYMDANYREEIIFELPSTTADLTLSDTELQQAKMIFGVWCYCKGKAGNYKITTGDFSKKGNEIHINFPAVVAEQKMSIIFLAL